MLKSEEILKLVNRSIDTLRLDRKPEMLYAPIKYILSIGGKRIRPVLMLLAYNMYKDSVSDIMSQACAIEAYHNYTLLHDDLMDNADMRRGRETVHKRWNANTAILSGDTMLVIAYEYMMKGQTANLPKLLQLFTKTAIEIGEGQQYDMDFECRQDVSEVEYIEMIRLKTSVLLACSLKIGAMLAEAPESDQEKLYKYGEQVGLAFQLQDDYLDVFGDESVFGKTIGGDIVSNKKTYMLIKALELSDMRQRAELEDWITAAQFDEKEKIRAVTKLYKEIGIDRLAKEKISYYYNQSKTYLEAVNLPTERKQELADYVSAMMNRQY